MDKKVLLAIVAAVVMLGAVGGYYAYSTGKLDLDIPFIAQKTYESPTELKELAKSGASMKCEVDNDQIKGIVYIDSTNNRTRMEIADFKITPAMGDGAQDDNAQPDHMIGTQETIYLWTDGNKEGIKVNISDTGQTPPTNNFLQETIDQAEENAEGDTDTAVTEGLTGIKCTKWQVNDKMFTPPSDVTFKDPLAEMRDQLNQQAQDTPEPHAEGQAPTEEDLQKMLDDLQDAQ